MFANDKFCLTRFAHIQLSWSRIGLYERRTNKARTEYPSREVIHSGGTCETPMAGYKIFKTESQQLDPTYSPQTVNTDGWSATQNTWQALFPQITLILCFLHAFLKIKERCRSCPHLLKTMGQHVWAVYHAPTKAHFSQRMRRLREWAQQHLTGSVQEKLLALCHKAPHFKIAFDFPTAYRTSNALDRLMNYQDHLLYQEFRPNKELTQLELK